MTVVRIAMGDGGRGTMSYALCQYEGRPRIKLRIGDEGVVLGPDGLSWHAGGAERRRRYADIRKVWLATAHVHKSGTTGSCHIRFADGRRLTVVSTTAWGYPEDARTPLYGDFVRDLHARLAAIDHSAIEFRAGNTEGRQMLLQVTLVVALLLFVALPIGFTIYFRAWEALLATGIGAGFVWPLFGVMRDNEPRRYAPDRLPTELVP